MPTGRKYGVSLLLLLFLLCSCERRPLTYYSENSLHVSVDWSKADLDEESEYGATLIFYPRDGGTPKTVLMGNRHETTVNLPPGHYNVLLFNRSFEDFGGIAFRGKDLFHTLEAYAKQVESRSGTRIILHAPEKLAVDVAEDIVANEDMHFTPRKLTRTIEVQIHVKGLKNIREAVCTMDGLPVSIFLSSGKTSGEAASHTFELGNPVYNEGSSEDGILSGSFNVFGFDAETDHELQFSALLVDNKTQVQQSFPCLNITETEDEKGNITLNVKAKVPESIPNIDIGGSGLDADVDDWENNENCDIEM